MTTAPTGCPATCPRRQHIEGIEGMLTVYAEWATLTEPSAKLKSLRQRESRRLARFRSQPCEFAYEADHLESRSLLPQKAVHAD